MTTTTKAPEIPQAVIDALVLELVDLNEQADQVKARQADIRAQLAKLPVGQHVGAEAPFAVRPPSRKFDVMAAYHSLAEDVKPACVAPVAALVKAQIPPAQVDRFMHDGDGPNVVTFK